MAPLGETALATQCIKHRESCILAAHCVIVRFGIIEVPQCCILQRHREIPSPNRFCRAHVELCEHEACIGGLDPHACLGIVFKRSRQLILCLTEMGHSMSRFVGSTIECECEYAKDVAAVGGLQG